MGADLRARVVATRDKTAPGTDVANSRPKTLAEQIEAKKDVFQAALPDGAEARHLIRDAISLLRQNPNLAKCDTNTVLGGLMTFCQLGLRPGVLGHGWLIPFKKRVKDGNTWADKWEAQVVIGYKGYADLVHRSGLAETMVSRPVHENDEFTLEYGIDDRLVHKPEMRGPRGEITGYYTVIKFKGGGYVFWYMSKAECEEHRDKHAMARKPVYEQGQKVGEEVVGPWASDFDSMSLKGLALDTPIPTPAGWSTMQRLSLGDEVLDMHGQPCRVIAKSEVKHLDCYRIEFGNGDSVVCDGEHRWLARIASSRGSGSRELGVWDWPVYSIAELYEAKAADRAVAMPVSLPLALPDAYLPIDPWVLGLWLGDGSRSAPVITCHIDTVDQITAGIASAGYVVGRVRRSERGSGNTMSVYIKGLKKVLAEVGLLGHKHVPPAYLRGSARQRLAFLRGLMDSDGHVDKRGRAIFSNTNEELADAVAELARSLGEMVHCPRYNGHGFGREVAVYAVSWQPNLVPVTLRAKRARVRPRRNSSHRVVRSIEKIPTVPTQCIAVDSLTHTFLAGRDMAPTHNTTFLRAQNLAPKSTMLARATAVDGAVRRDMGDADEMFFAGHPDHDPNVIDGEVEGEPVDEPATPQQPEPAAPPAEPEVPEQVVSEQRASSTRAKPPTAKPAELPNAETDPQGWHNARHPKKNQETGDVEYADRVPGWCELCDNEQPVKP